MQERLISQSGVTAQDRFTWAIIITNHNTVYPLRASVAEGRMKKGIFCLLLNPTSVHILRNFLRKSSYVYKRRTNMSTVNQKSQIFALQNCCSLFVYLSIDDTKAFSLAAYFAVMISRVPEKTDQGKSFPLFGENMNL